MATIENGSTSVNAVKMYIYNDAVICGTLPEGVEEGLTWEDQANGKYLLLSAAQVEFFLENPNLAASEIYNLTTDEEADYTFLREEYLKMNDEYCNSLAWNNKAFILCYHYDSEDHGTCHDVYYSLEELKVLYEAGDYSIWKSFDPPQKRTFTKEEFEQMISGLTVKIAEQIQLHQHKMLTIDRSLKTKKDFKEFDIKKDYEDYLTVDVYQQIAK